MSIVKWLCTQRLNSDEETYLPKERSIFTYDLGQIYHLESFRKQAHITQVYLNPDKTVRSRLTHSLEVSNIGAQILAYLEDEISSLNKDKNISPEYLQTYFDAHQALQAICLTHDIGHPPFAHTGENYLKGTETKLKRRFDSNINNLRILGGLSPLTQKSIDLSVAILDGTLKKKHSGPFKIDIYSSDEANVIEKISEKNGTDIKLENINIFCENRGIELQNDLHLANTKGIIYMRSPLTYIMEVADDISYLTSDIEDALSIKAISKNDIKRCLEEFSDFKLFKKNGEEIEEIEEKEKELRDCFEHEKYSTIKAYLIRFFINEVKICFKEMVESYKFNKNEQKRLQLVNDLPELMLAYSLKSHKKNELEFGNFLFMGARAQKIHDFKKDIYKKILRSKKVLEDNAKSKEIIKELINILIPDPNDSEHIQKTAAFLPEKYRNAIYEILDNNKKESSNTIEEYFLDYISGLTDREAFEKVEEFKNYTVLRKAS